MEEQLTEAAGYQETEKVLASTWSGAVAKRFNQLRNHFSPGKVCKDIG